MLLPNDDKQGQLVHQDGYSFCHCYSYYTIIHTYQDVFDGYISIIVSSRFTLDHNKRCLQDFDYYDDSDSDAYAGEFVEKF
jgi:hypothetical protein